MDWALNAHVIWTHSGPTLWAQQRPPPDATTDHPLGQGRLRARGSPLPPALLVVWQHCNRTVASMLYPNKVIGLDPSAGTLGDGD